MLEHGGGAGWSDCTPTIVPRSSLMLPYFLLATMAGQSVDRPRSRDPRQPPRHSPSHQPSSLLYTAILPPVLERQQACRATAPAARPNRLPRRNLSWFASQSRLVPGVLVPTPTENLTLSCAAAALATEIKRPAMIHKLTRRLMIIRCFTCEVYS